MLVTASALSRFEIELEVRISASDLGDRVDGAVRERGPAQIRVDDDPRRVDGGPQARADFFAKLLAHGLLERRDPHFELVFRQALRDRSTKLGAYGSGGVRDRLSSERVREGVDCRSRQNSLDARHTPEERFAAVGRGGRRGEPL